MHKIREKEEYYSVNIVCYKIYKYTTTYIIN